MSGGHMGSGFGDAGGGGGDMRGGRGGIRNRSPIRRVREDRSPARSSR